MQREHENRDLVKFWKLVAHLGQWLIALSGPDQVQVALKKDVNNITKGSFILERKHSFFIFATTQYKTHTQEKTVHPI